MLRSLFFTLLLSSKVLVCLSQMSTTPGVDPGVYDIDRSLEASRCEVAPKVNGEVNDPCWAVAAIATDFIVNRPEPGKKASYKTNVQVVYDDEAIYIAMYCFDSSPDSILNQLAGRDGDGNSDYCGVSFSPYRDGLNGWTFAVSPSGEQFDAQANGNGGEDVAWNAVWQCETSITRDGWIAEFRIPFAALRFPDAAEQNWGINFFREVRRIREHAFWNAVDPTQPGYLTQLGTLTGIKDIDPPVRLFFYPFASAYLDISENGDGTNSTVTSYNGGMDLKYGLSESFTLDATLIPDFGQTISDALVLNLTPFEVRFDENRQFFTEGTELFSKGGLFYSRRIGFIPDNFSPGHSMSAGEYFKSTPQQTQLINATKISGRTKKGTGLGFINAISAPEHAIIVNEEGIERKVEYYPLTNYNLIVIDQNLKNNSYISLINTSVMRNGSTYDANVSGVDFNVRNKKNTYSIGGFGAYNRKFNWLDSDDDGFAYNIYLSKISGQFNWSAGHSIESDTYDPNDMGFLFNNNSHSYWVSLNYNIYKSFGRFNRMWSYLYTNYSNLYKPNTFNEMYVEGGVGFMTKKFLSYEFNFDANPTHTFDYFEPRIEDAFFKRPTYMRAGAWISTDYRKTLAWDIGGGYAGYSNQGHYMANLRIAPRLRVNDHLMFTYVFSWQNQFNDLGFATFDSTSNPVFGRRDVISYTNVLGITYAFNPVMNTTCRVRHYWGYSKYYEFFELNENGELQSGDYNSILDDGSSEDNQNFNSFTIDLVYKWIFAPGSEMSLVWKNGIYGFENEIPDGLIDDIKLVSRLPQSNSFSVKVLYFLDYRSIFKSHHA